jgi:LysR family transcriptional regulator for bpeEF and oprC
MDNLHGILVFLNVVEAGTLSGAARRLGVTTAAVSAALARLEKKLSVRLLDRTTRRVAMTPEGGEFYSRCSQIVRDLDDAERVVSQSGREPAGLLRVGMPQGLGRMWLIPQLPRFLRQYPGITLEVVCRDFSAQTRDSELDISIRSGELQPSRLAARRLARCRYAVCASPEYFERHGMPKTVDSLDQHVCLAYRRPRNGRLRQWRFKGPDGEYTRALRGAMTFNSNEALVAAAVAGLGVIQVAEYYVRDELAAGDLVETLPAQKAGGYEISVLFPHYQNLAPKHRAFVDFLVAVFSEPPWQDGEGG